MIRGNHGEYLKFSCLKWHIRLCFAVLLVCRLNTCLLFECAYTFCFHVRHVEIVGILLGYNCRYSMAFSC